MGITVSKASQGEADAAPVATPLTRYDTALAHDCVSILRQLPPMLQDAAYHLETLARRKSENQITIEVNAQHPTGISLTIELQLNNSSDGVKIGFRTNLNSPSITETQIPETVRDEIQAFFNTTSALLEKGNLPIRSLWFAPIDAFPSLATLSARENKTRLPDSDRSLEEFRNTNLRLQAMALYLKEIESTTLLKIEHTRGGFPRGSDSHFNNGVEKCSTSIQLADGRYLIAFDTTDSGTVRLALYKPNRNRAGEPRYFSRDQIETLSKNEAESIETLVENIRMLPIRTTQYETAAKGISRKKLPEVAAEFFQIHQRIVEGRKSEQTKDVPIGMFLNEGAQATSPNRVSTLADALRAVVSSPAIDEVIGRDISVQYYLLQSTLAMKLDSILPETSKKALRTALQALGQQFGKDELATTGARLKAFWSPQTALNSFFDTLQKHEAFYAKAYVAAILVKETKSAEAE